MKLAHTPHVDIAYEEHGAADAPATVLLLHGFPDSPRTWDGVVQGLAGEAVRLVTPYQRGCGATRIVDAAAAAGQVAALARDALDLADALGIERFLAVGHDWGSRAAQGAAILAPERLTGVVLLATPYGTAADPPPELRQAQAQAAWYQWYFHTPQGRQALAGDRLALCRHLWQIWSPGWSFAESDFAAAAASFANDQFVDTVLHYYQHRWGNAPGCSVYGRDQAAIDAAPRLAVPASLLVGGADTVNLPAAARGTERHYAATFRQVTLGGIGHFIQRQRPRLVADVIRGHLHGAGERGAVGVEDGAGGAATAPPPALC